jgi:cell division protease FtsH
MFSFFLSIVHSCFIFNSINGFIDIHHNQNRIIRPSSKIHLIHKKYPITKYKAGLIKNPNENNQFDKNNTFPIIYRKHFVTPAREVINNDELDDMKKTSDIIENLLKKFNEDNQEKKNTDMNDVLFINGNKIKFVNINETIDNVNDKINKIFLEKSLSEKITENMKANKTSQNTINVVKRIIIPIVPPRRETEQEDDDESENYDIFGFPLIPNSNFRNQNQNQNQNQRDRKSEHFEIVSNSSTYFTDIGGYDNIKLELAQCIDILCNYSKYKPYNVRVPKGLIFEGSPGNGKTLFAKALAGEANTNFIAVSGSEFQNKYVGVGSSRIRELFTLAKKNIPCVIFIDEIDAIGRKRSGDGDSSSSERDNTLNELLIALDGFKDTKGIFIIGATNRPDLLDPALIRPGRIDKRIFIDNPDRKTREKIVDIHIKGKPFDDSVNIDNIVDLTEGFSSSQIENLLNEAMLNALRYGRKKFTDTDIDVIINKIIAGWQPNEHQYTNDMISQIAIHELGHAVVGILCQHHPKLKKVIINLSSPKSPAYTIFDTKATSISSREALIEHLMILLSGRIAEEVFYGKTHISTGAINDFEEAFKLSDKMIKYYGMGKKIIYSVMSDKYKEMVDNEITTMINDAYKKAEHIIRIFKDLIEEGAEELIIQKIITADYLLHLINTKYKNNIINEIIDL